jgi:hypothetical protein
MKVLGIAEGEFEMQTVETRLKEAGLYGQYEGQIKGQDGALVMVHVRNAEEKDQVKGIFERSGVTEISYRDEPPSAEPF